MNGQELDLLLLYCMHNYSMIFHFMI